MMTRRRTRLATALIALISLVFMQFAVARYVCPGLASTAIEVAALAEAAMPCAGSKALNPVDAQSSLCGAHCQTERQSANTYKLPPIVDAHTVLVIFSAPTPAPVTLWEPLQAPLLERATAPPLAVRHCCFRI